MLFILQNYIYKQFMPVAIDKDTTTPYLPTTTGRRLRPSSLSSTTERMLIHHIYQQQLEGGYDPLVYQLLLKGCFYTLFTIYYQKEATTPLQEYSLPQHHPTTLVCFYQTSRSTYIFNIVIGFSLLPSYMYFIVAAWIWTTKKHY